MSQLRTYKKIAADVIYENAPNDVVWLLKDMLLI